MSPIRQIINGIERTRYAEILKGQYVNGRLSTLTLAEKHGLSEKMVATLLGEVGTPMRSANVRPVSVEETADIIARYERGEPIKEIRNATKRGPGIIYRVLDDAGIDRRDHNAVAREARKRGSERKSAKLDEKKVKIIRQLIAKGYGDRRIASRFQVSGTAIWQIRTKRTWNHID